MFRTTLLVICILITSSFLIGAAQTPFSGYGVPEIDPDLTAVVVNEGFARVSSLPNGVYLSAAPLTVKNKSNPYSLAKVSGDVLHQIYYKPCKSCSNWYVLSLSTVAVPQPGKCQWRYTYNP